MKALELKIPPAILMLVFGFFMWLVDYLLPQFRQAWSWHLWAAIGSATLALLLVLSGVISFRLAKTTVDPTQPEKASSVVISGIYAYTRNPMYLGFLLMLLAFMFKLTNPITAIVLPLFVSYMNQFQIKPEEKALEKLFGQAFMSYCEKVRRWF
ncbi:MAG: isoprenylcysteine carboxylmethyltransferase family protein [Xanthomonadales bacterium]|nr:isoprenylcysteine carboxylmethyltransferase family protein [Xanthomonadales bacterium]